MKLFINLTHFKFLFKPYPLPLVKGKGKIFLKRDEVPLKFPIMYLRLRLSLKSLPPHAKNTSPYLGEGEGFFREASPLFNSPSVFPPPKGRDFRGGLCPPLRYTPLPLPREGGRGIGC